MATHSDSFTGTSGTDLEVYDSGWSVGTAAGLRIQANQCQGTIFSDRVQAYDGGLGFSTDHHATATFSTDAGAGGMRIGPGVRITAARNGYGLVGSGDYFLSVLRVNISVVTSLSTTTTLLSTSDVLKLDVSGTTLTSTLNGGSSGAPSPVTDSTYATGNPGVYCRGTHSVDDFVGSDEVVGSTYEDSISVSGSMSAAQSGNLILQQSGVFSVEAGFSNAPDMNITCAAQMNGDANIAELSALTLSQAVSFLGYADAVSGSVADFDTVLQVSGANNFGLILQSVLHSSAALAASQSIDISSIRVFIPPGSVERFISISHDGKNYLISIV